MEIEVYSIRFFSRMHNENMVVYFYGTGNEIGNMSELLERKKEEMSRVGTKENLRWEYEGNYNISGLYEISDMYPGLSRI